ncbi:MAG: general secretion pathway protein GspE [Planctomycetales bacterium 12-60-4]|nr:MAG: general secretion pathway protein GspE [Planctomycetales bacterium 12-60-4]
MAAAAKIDVYKEWLGIPEGPRPPDHYALLRLPQFEDDVAKIQKNYKKLNAAVRKYATGKYAAESQELLNELARAMLCLTDAERKVEYDREQGREIDDRDATTGRRPMTSYLQAEGVLTSAQVNEVKSHAERTGLSQRDTVVQLKLADQETATRAYASEIGLAYIDLADMIPDENVLDSVPKSVVRRYTCLPLFVDGERVLVACSTEPSMELEEEFRLRFGAAMRPVLATPKAIKEGIDQYYAQGLRKEKAVPMKVGGAASKLMDKVAQKKPVSQMTDEEKEERSKLGIVLCSMTFVVLANLDAWVLHDLVSICRTFASVDSTCRNANGRRFIRPQKKTATSSK